MQVYLCEHVSDNMNVCGFILIISLSSYFSARASTNTDEETLCVYMKSCVLPCRFTPGSDLYIQWIKRDSDLTVHSFHHGQNQDLDQYRKYRGRTSLFEEEMNRGKASLLLRDVTLEDQGRYLCLANDQVTYVNMKVFAPVSQVHVDSIDGNLICRAHEIYPEPSLKWTINPEPSAEPQTSVNHSETGLFSVYSFVRLPRTPLFKYTCTVRTEHSTKSKTYERTDPYPYPLPMHPSEVGSAVVAAVVVVVLAAVAAAVFGVWSVLSRRSRKIWADADADVDVPNPEEEAETEQ